MRGGAITLVGDGLENPHNVRTMADAAAMFGAAWVLRDRAAVLPGWDGDRDGPPPATISAGELTSAYAPLVALENLPHAAEVYGFTLPRGVRPALIAGNERRGVAVDLLALAGHAVQIPTRSRGLNSLNVAAAAAVALYYLSRGGGGGQRVAAHPERRRPEVLFVGPGEHVEAGSAIRSAGAFGWRRLFVADRHGVWFGVARGPRTEGRAAARQARNTIRVVPVAADGGFAFAEAVIVTADGDGLPLHRVNLAGGPSQVVVPPDEGAVDVDREPWERLARRVRFASIGARADGTAYRYRLPASIALAEVQRQIGRPAPAAPRGRPRPPVYDRALRLQTGIAGEEVSAAELLAY